MFAGLAAAGCAGVGGALYAGYLRASEAGPEAGFVFAGILALFILAAICTGVWLLFDENVAKPIQRISAAMRVKAHSDPGISIDLEQARYLGDLAPAIGAVTGRLASVMEDADQEVAAETSRLAAERAYLALLLTEIPVAIVLVSPTHQIMLYDGQSADILGQVHVPRLSSSAFDYFNEGDLRAAYDRLSGHGGEVEAEVRGARGNFSFRLKLKKLSQASGYMILIDSAESKLAPAAGRPLIYDFDLSEHESERAIEDRKLRDLSFAVFDTETTGLMPSKDEIVQIGAVRVVNGRVVVGEVMDQLVDPGRPITPASTKVHGITDAMVAGAPDAPTVVARFHEFAEGSVIVAHNAPFDMAFLKRHGQATGLAFDHPIVDTVLLSAVVFGATEDHSLDAVCARLGVVIPPEDRHTALGDARVTAAVLCKSLPILKSRGIDSFGDLVRETRKHGRLLKDMN
ncbi:hypothetical protein GCM10011316_02980 [Roseibium aquae]|uniref:DNA-directed DNA polymerase n=2 Tax=Roseibium aquae TaxID=1323746 RepID=A0A916WVZ8_9HYPH|nr:hypothetical protein GCM10011316_02980 [Roseibium aquae]